MNDAPDVTEMSKFTLVHVGTRENPDDMAKSLSATIGFDVSAQPNAVANGPGDLRVFWYGPGRWLIHAPGLSWTLGKIPGCAVTDLSDSRRVFRWRGEGAVRLLQQSCPLDLRKSAMPAGTSALTQFDRFAILLYRTGANEFDLYVDRSYGDSLPGAN